MSQPPGSQEPAAWRLLDRVGGYGFAVSAFAAIELMLAMIGSLITQRGIPGARLSYERNISASALPCAIFSLAA